MGYDILHILNLSGSEKLMSKRVKIDAGICGFITTVEVVREDFRRARVKINSTCPHVTKMAQELAEVDPFKEISFRQSPLTHQLAALYLPHACCLVPAGIIKAIEV